MSARARAVGARQGRHLAKLVDDLLDIGRVMTGKILVHAEPVDLADAVQAHVAALQAAGKLDERHVSVEAEPVWVRADPVRLEQVLSNLVSNALRYTPAGGHIDIRVARIGCEALLEVEDDGVGIAPHLLPHIFDLFVQSERRPERSLGGLGIGLTLVRRLVELQGGRVEAHSEGKWRGSRFAVRLPAIEGAASRPEEPRAPKSDQRARRVLIVEDNEDAREMLGALLRHEGHEVNAAEDGREGVEAALRLRPEIVLLDVGLPKLDGYGAAREIRAALGDAVTLVAVTGYGSHDDRRRAQEAGFDHHLRKPLDVPELRALLEEAPRARG